jgi:hypothetical protein
MSIMTPQDFIRLNPNAHLQKKVSLEIFLQLTSILPRSLYNKLFIVVMYKWHYKYFRHLL